MINWIEVINSPVFRVTSLLAAFVLGIAFHSWHIRTKDDDYVWDETELSDDEDVSRIQEGYVMAAETATIEPVPAWNHDSGATAYIQLRDLQEPGRRFYATPVPATAVMEFDPNRPTGIPFQAYAPAHRLPEDPSLYPHRRLRGLIEDTSLIPLGEIKELVNA